jgi:hypothetical protein
MSRRATVPTSRYSWLLTLKGGSVTKKELDVDAAEIARGYKALLEVERGWRDLKQLDLRPVYHRKDERIIAHVQLSWLALLLIRTAEIACQDTWRNLAHELDRVQLHTYDTGHGNRLPAHPPHRQAILHS